MTATPTSVCMCICPSFSQNYNNVSSYVKKKKANKKEMKQLWELHRQKSHSLAITIDGWMVKWENTLGSASRHRSTHAIRRMSWLYTCCILSLLEGRHNRTPYFQLHIDQFFFSLNDHATFFSCFSGDTFSIWKIKWKRQLTHVTMSMTMMMVMMFSTRFSSRRRRRSRISWW